MNRQASMSAAPGPAGHNVAGLGSTQSEVFTAARVETRPTRIGKDNGVVWPAHDARPLPPTKE